MTAPLAIVYILVLFGFGAAGYFVGWRACRIAMELATLGAGELRDCGHNAEDADTVVVDRGNGETFAWCRACYDAATENERSGWYAA